MDLKGIIKSLKGIISSLILPKNYSDLKKLFSTKQPQELSPKYLKIYDVN